MDLNYLEERYQESLMRAKSATSDEARIAHAGLAREYARRIAQANADAAARRHDRSKPTLQTAA